MNRDDYNCSCVQGPCAVHDEKRGKLILDKTRCVHCGFGHFEGHYTSSDGCINRKGLFFKPVEKWPLHAIADEVVKEAFRAASLFPPMNSPHEAMAVILEEYTEYQLEVFKHNTSKPDRDTRPRQREELIQLAAMCMRAILDTIDKPDFYEDYAARARKEYDLTKGAK